VLLHGGGVVRAAGLLRLFTVTGSQEKFQMFSSWFGAFPTVSSRCTAATSPWRSVLARGALHAGRAACVSEPALPRCLAPALLFPRPWASWSRCLLHAGVPARIGYLCMCWVADRRHEAVSRRGACGSGPVGGSAGRVLELLENGQPAQQSWALLWCAQQWSFK